MFYPALGIEEIFIDLTVLQAPETINVYNNWQAIFICPVAQLVTIMVTNVAI